MSSVARSDILEQILAVKREEVEMACRAKPLEVLRREAEATRASECTEHVKDDAGLADLAEVQPPAHDDVKEIVRREATIAR